MGAVGGVRRSHALALAAGAALLLLLLARLPPRTGAPAPKALGAVAPPAPAPAPQRPAPAAGAPSAAPASTAAAERANQSRVDKAAKAPVAAAAAAYVRLTGELYEAGHSRPHPELCPSLGARLRLLILVASAPAHAAARDAIRLTWGHFARRSDVALAFVLGAPAAALRAALDAEDALYGDLVVGNSVDSYSNLTLKTLSMLEWADAYCPRAPRLLKTDDDMFINVPRLLQFAAAPRRANASRTVWGKVRRKTLPVRTVKSKYYLSPQQFPARVLPDFATGPAYLLTADAVRPLLLEAPAQPYVRLEDVFVTGVLATRLGLRRQHTPEFYNMKMSSQPCVVQRGFAIHMVRYHEQFDLWRKLLDGRSKCS